MGKLSIQAKNPQGAEGASEPRGEIGPSERSRNDAFRPSLRYSLCHALRGTVEYSGEKENLRISSALAERCANVFAQREARALKWSGRCDVLTRVSRSACVISSWESIYSINLVGFRSANTQSIFGIIRAAIKVRPQA